MRLRPLGARRSRYPQTLGGKIAATIVLAVLMVGGTLACCGTILDICWPRLRTYWWREVPCVIEHSEIREGKGDFHDFAVRYRFCVDGHDCDGFDLGRPSSSQQYEDVKPLLDRYPKGKQTVCYVDPSDRSVAVLERGCLVSLLLPLFLLAYVGAAAFAIRETWRRRA